MDSIFSVSALAVTAALMALLVKKHEKSMGLLISIAAAMIIFLLCADMLKTAVDFMGELSSLAGMSREILSPVLKTVGIGIVTKLCSQVCRDAGEGAIATLTEFAGAAGAIAVAIPLMRAVVDMVRDIL
ncbi:MAG: stage III sporulation protein AD [Oscillospiraceae bacterium]|nr:stage III sporulation protein AD [Oscillospiraceae bacterium]